MVSETGKFRLTFVPLDFLRLESRKVWHSVCGTQENHAELPLLIFFSMNMDCMIVLSTLSRYINLKPIRLYQKPNQILLKSLVFEFNEFSLRTSRRQAPDLYILYI